MDDEIAYVRVVGVSFYQEALAKCVAGEPVRFIHEPDNPHDEMALRVTSVLSETIGYLPRASWVHRMVHELGRGVTATIASVGLSRSCLLGATLAVGICDDDVLVASYYPDRPPPEPPKGGFRYWVKSPGDVALLLARRKQSGSPKQVQHP